MSKLKHIKYLLEALIAYLGYAIFLILPIDVASAVGAKMMRFVGPKLKAAEIAKKNLKLCFSDITDKEIETILDKMWNNLGRIIGELPHIKDLSDIQFSSICKFTDLSKFEQPCIFVSGHLGNFELASRMLRFIGMNAHLVYRPANNPYVDYLINHIRQKHANPQIPKGKGGLKKMIQCIENGKSIAMLVDQKMNDGIKVKFFGIDAYTTALPAKLAHKYNVPIYLTYMKRTDKCNFEVCFKILKANDDILYTTQLINDYLEEWIRQDPSQWFWIHKRWKI